MPDETNDEIFAGYLFRPFLGKYSTFFRIPIKKNSTYFSTIHDEKLKLPFEPTSFYNWGHQVYRDFMMEVLRKLQPRREDVGTVLMAEMDECLEMFFVMKGTIGAGFEINKIR